MAKFNLEEYEPVEVRITKFYELYPQGCILTNMEYDDGKRIIFKATVFDQGRTIATGWAQEYRDTELKTNKYGGSYESVNYSSHLENCETSAIGRALANANFAGSKRPSREEMAKVSRMDRSEKIDATSHNIDKELDKVRDEARALLIKHGLLGEKGTDFVMATIGKEKPEILEDYLTIIAVLEAQNG